MEVCDSLVGGKGRGGEESCFFFGFFLNIYGGILGTNKGTCDLLSLQIASH